MTPEEYKKKKLIKDVVDSPLFEVIIQEIKSELAEKMLESEKEADRQALYNEAKLLNSLIGRLTAIANEVRMLNAA